jgi:hypothetical protein
MIDALCLLVDSNPHCHVLIAASDDESSWLLGEGNDSWLWLQPRGQFEIGEIESLPRVIPYITKELRRGERRNVVDEHNLREGVGETFYADRDGEDPETTAALRGKPGEAQMRGRSRDRAEQ